ncbi:MerR family transcriptional regulator [Acidimicrobiia bacterium]|nr:MerR family transcriptional regulator [Acidimicrobiia bacterium]MDC1071304.1 MerR family transcriptional regulator [Acidimicrobiia bacterium]
MQQGYTGPEVCKITGITYRQLDHWTTSSLIKASIRNLKGSGFHRIYSFQDIIQIKLVNKLREAGVSLQKIRIALQNIESVLGQNINLSDVSIFSDGKSIYVITDNDQMIDLLKKGQAVFGISLGPVHLEAEAEIFSLYPDKVSTKKA